MALAEVPPKAPASAPASKRMPIAAMVVLVGGLVALLGAIALYRSGVLSLPGSGAAVTDAAGPTAATPADASAQPAVQAPAPADAAPPPADAAPPGPVSGPASGAAAAAPESAMPRGAPPAPIPAAAAPPAARPAPPPPPPPFEKTYECRKYATFRIEPDTAIVTVDDEIIGIADEWADTPRTKKYEFKKDGVHYVKLSHRDYKTIWLRFIVGEKADDKTAVVELEMKDAKDAKDEKKKDEKKKDEKKR